MTSYFDTLFTPLQHIRGQFVFGYVTYFLSDIWTENLDTPTCWVNRCKDYWGICSNQKPILFNLSSINTLLFTWGFLFCTEPVSLIFLQYCSLYRRVIRHKENRETFGDTFSMKIFSWKYCITDKNALFFAVTHKWTHTLNSLTVNTILKSEGNGISSEVSGTI